MVVVALRDAADAAYLSVRGILNLFLFFIPHLSFSNLCISPYISRSEIFPHMVLPVFPLSRSELSSFSALQPFVFPPSYFKISFFPLLSSSLSSLSSLSPSLSLLSHHVQTTLGGIQEQILEALENKNPNVKSETLLFVCRCFQQCTAAMLPKASLKAFCPPIIKVQTVTTTFIL